MKKVETLIMSAEEFRKNVTEFYSDVLKDDMEAFLKTGFPLGGEMLMKGIDNMSIPELIEEATPYLETETMDETQPGVIIVIDEDESPILAICQEDATEEVKAEKEKV